MLSEGQVKLTCDKDIFDSNQNVPIKARYIRTASTQEIFNQESNIISYTHV